MMSEDMRPWLVCVTQFYVNVVYKVVYETTVKRCVGAKGERRKCPPSALGLRSICHPSTKESIGLKNCSSIPFCLR